MNNAAQSRILANAGVKLDCMTWIGGIQRKAARDDFAFVAFANLYDHDIAGALFGSEWEADIPYFDSIEGVFDFCTKHAKFGFIAKFTDYNDVEVKWFYGESMKEIVHKALTWALTLKGE